MTIGTATTTTTNSIQFSSIGVYQSAGSTAQVPNTKPAQEQKHNTNTKKEY